MNEQQSSDINPQNRFAEQDCNSDVEVDRQEENDQEIPTTLNSNTEEIEAVLKNQPQQVQNTDNNHFDENQEDEEIESILEDSSQQVQSQEIDNNPFNEIQEDEETKKSDNLSVSNDGSIEAGINAAIGDSNIQNQNVVKVYVQDKGTGSKESSKESEEKPFNDPTTELSFKSRKSFEFDPVDLEHYSQTLREENLIVISCFNPSILSEFAYALGEIIEINCDKRLLTFTGKNSQRSDLTIELLSEKQEIGETVDKGKEFKKTLIVVDGVGTQLFWDSLIVHSPITADKIKQNLKDLDRYLICIAEPETIERIFQKKQQKDLFFTHHKIPFLSYLLKAKFIRYSAENLNELESKIISQKAQQLWGSSEIEFYDLVYGFTTNGQLISEIEKRDQLRETSDINEIDRKLKTVRASDIFKDDEELENIVLYVATFFPNLNPDDFDRMVSWLIGDRTITVNVESSVSNKDGDLKTIKEQVVKSLKEIWLKNPDKILRKKCNLKAVVYQESTRIIDFDLPYLRKELREYLEEEYPLFLRNQFNQIQELGVLFDSSLKVTENVINLYTSMAVSYPERYGEDWLVRIVLLILHSKQQLENYTKQQLEEQINAGTIQQDQIIQLLQDFDSSNLQLDLVFSRVSDLVREMLNYSQLENVVNGFLEQLIAAKRHDAVLVIVKRLRFAPQFDEFYWLKQLLERGNETTRAETYRFLHNQTKTSGFRIYDLLAKIITWLPESKRENYSKSNKCALNLFYNYCVETTENFPIKYYGKWQSKHPLFAIFFRELSEEYLDILVEFVFSLLYLESEENILEFISSLLAEWWIILRGFSINDLHPESSKLSIQLLKKVIDVTNKRQQQKILSCWYDVADSYLQSMDEGQRKLERFEAQNFPDRSLKKLDDGINQINSRRQLINQLAEEFELNFDK